MEPWLVALTAFALVFLAELGDRTQFLVFALATRHPRWTVFAGAACAFAVQTFVAVLLGGRLGSWLPTRLVLSIGGAVFLVLGGFSLWNAWRPGGLEGPDRHDAAPAGKRGAFVSVSLLVLLAELGDKTQIAAGAWTAATGAPVATFIGAFAALLASAGLALLLGVFVTRWLSVGTVRGVAAGAFIVAGALMIAAAVL